MNKSDLKDGMVVTIRGGNQCILIEGNLFKNNFTSDLTTFDFNEDLTSKKNKNYDIVKVFDIGKTKELWKREEIDWSKVPVGAKVSVSDNENNWYEHLFIDYQYDEEIKFKAVDIISKQIHNWKYCKLAEKPKEEVAFDDIDKEMNKYCDEHNESEICNQECSICGMKYILDNYNVTRKDNK